MKLQRYVLIAMLLAGAITISFFEAMIPLPITIPGFKLGLANIIVIILIMEFSFKEALGLTLGRILLVSLLRGSFLNIPFFNSLAGGLLSFAVMFTFSKVKIFSLAGISVLGALAHTIGQIAVVIFITSTWELVLFYLPVIMVLSVGTGIFNAIVAKRFLELELIDNLIDTKKEETNQND